MLTVRTSENTVITSFRLISERQDFSSVRTGENTVRARARIQILRVGPVGFSFTSQVSKKRRERYPTYRYFPVVHRKKMLKLKEKLKQITDRRAPGGIERVKRELKLTLRGWVNYFYKAIPAKWAERTDQWLHRRVRQIYWKQ